MAIRKTSSGRTVGVLFAYSDVAGFAGFALTAQARSRVGVVLQICFLRPFLIGRAKTKK